ncbi:MAG: hypothetical protein KAX11_05660 [Candidatus Aminicenantes bacterium]|nr:hypothetical protein [Candidatus Aminicenantes bacterium]
MKKRVLSVFILSLFLLFLAGSSGFAGEQTEKTPPKKAVNLKNPISAMTQAMIDQLAKNLHVKNIVGDPVKVGSMTIIPIIMIDIGYGGGEGGPEKMRSGGFYMGGEAKALGFVIITKKEVKFVSAGKAPRK